MGHTAQESRTAIFLPDGKKSSTQILGDIKLWVKIVPAGEESARLVVEKNEKESDKEKGDNRPETNDELTEVAELSEGETVGCFGNVFGHKLV